MSQIIDARGKACPTPVLLARQALAETDACAVLVDNQTAVENLTRLGDSRDRPVRVSPCEGGFRVDFPGGDGTQATTEATPRPATAGDWALFVGRDVVGSGQRELGTNLMRMFFYTLTQSDDLPAAVLLMNDGVKLTVLDEQVAEHLSALALRGVEVLVCGTCLNFYGLTDQVRTGTVSNMYDILTRMQAAGKVVTL